MTDNLTFTLSIEPIEGKTYQYHYHLGTIESVARECAINVFANANKYSGNGYMFGARTVALIRNGKMFDCFMGDKWSSEYDAWAE
jgi:hypothetical protein